MSCYIVNMKPFPSDKRTSKNIIPFQNQCIENRIFGIGWRTNYIFDGSIEDNEDCYRRQHVEETGEGIRKEHQTAINRCKDINLDLKNKEEVYIFFRHFENKNYVGKVKSGMEFYNGDLDKVMNCLSWSGIVEKWVEVKYNTSLPGAMQGELTKRSSFSTICRASSLFENLAKLIYSCDNDLSKIEDTQKIRITEDNFVDTLSPYDLEDLVYFYIVRENEGYSLIPSTCKGWVKEIEFVLESNDGKEKPITCQVKNQASIDAKKYIEYNKNFDKVYLFSGKSEYCLSDIPNYIECIERKKLFEVLKNNNILKNRLKAYYIF